MNPIPSPIPSSAGSSVLRLAAIIGLTALLSSACGGINNRFGGGEQGSGVALVETLDLDIAEVTEVEVTGWWNVTIVVSEDSPAVKIEIDDNLRDRIRVEVKDERLILSINEDDQRTVVGFNATVNLNKLDQLEASGATDVTVQGEQVGLRTIDLSGSAKVSVETLSVSDLDIELAGATTLSVSGHTVELTLDVDGASEARLFGLDATDVDVDLEGASSAQVTASGRVSGSANGASDLTIGGSPTIDVTESGASSVQQS